MTSRLRREDGAYPAAVRATLGSRAPPVLTVMGNPAALDGGPVALFCSVACPPEVVLRGYDLACELASRGLTVISGFHSAAERECLRVLLNGSRPVIWCPARGAGPRLLSPGHYHAITDGRLVVVTPFGRALPYPTAAAARARNRLVVAAASLVIVLHATQGGSVERARGDALAWGKPVWTLAGSIGSAGGLPTRLARVPAGHTGATAAVP